MNWKQEVLALAGVIAVLVGVPLFGLTYQKLQDWKLTEGGKGRIFDLTGSTWYGVWTLDRFVGYNYWRLKPKQATIRVKEGELVIIRAHSTDVTHAIHIPAFGVGPEFIEPGKVKVVKFVAEPAGVYQILCGRTCGPGHPFMKATLVVEKR